MSRGSRSSTLRYAEQAAEQPVLFGVARAALFELCNEVAEPALGAVDLDQRFVDLAAHAGLGSGHRERSCQLLQRAFALARLGERAAVVAQGRGENAVIARCRFDDAAELLGSRRKRAARVELAAELAAHEEGAFLRAHELVVEAPSSREVVVVEGERAKRTQHFLALGRVGDARQRTFVVLCGLRARAALGVQARE
jgi:hypothetical protein